MLDHILEVKNIHKNYARREVVNDVSFSVKAGQIVGLIGPNGAGKTTCFYITCGLVRSNKGKVFLNNKSIGHMPMHKRANLGLGYLPQEPSIFRKLSVEDNIMAILELNKTLPKKHRKHRLEELLSEFNVEHVRHIKGITLSGGERRRVEIARSLAMNPDIMLFDEVTAALDPETVKEVLVTIKDLAGEGMTCILVTHEMGFARELADHIYFTDRGIIVEHGPPETFFKEAKDPRTKEFLSQIL